MANSFAINKTVEKECKISVIVPAYNASKFIERCIKSIINTGYDSLDIIVINDGSSDATQQIVETLSQHDRRIRIIKQENSGVSSARNRGIDVATGEYVVFLDADDYLVDNIFSLINEHKDEELILFPIKENLDKELFYLDSTQIKKEILYPFEKEMIRYCFNSPWSKGYKLDNIKNKGIYFDTELKIGEDACFNYEYLRSVKKALCIEKKVYEYDTSSESVTRRFNKDYISIDVNYQLKIRDLLTEEGSDKELQLRSKLSLINGLIRCCSDYFMHPDNMQNIVETRSDIKTLFRRNNYLDCNKLYRKEIRKHFTCLQRAVLFFLKSDRMGWFISVVFMLMRSMRRKNCLK